LRDRDKCGGLSNPGVGAKEMVAERTTNDGRLCERGREKPAKTGKGDHFQEAPAKMMLDSPDRRDNSNAKTANGGIWQLSIMEEKRGEKK